jgi:nucleoside-diphosphate-sugar epimerase
MTNILITGGFGFIGGHLLNHLLNAPVRENANRPTVHVVDNLSTAPVPVETLLSDLNYPQGLTYDIADIYEWLRNGTGDDWDVIIHLASPVGPAGILNHAGIMAHEIIRDTVGLIQLAKRCNAILIDVSTSEVYGGGDQGLCHETMIRYVPAETTVRLEYAMGKLAAETSIINECAVNGLRAAIIRPFNVAGARQSGQGGFVLPRFVAQAMTGQSLTVFGDGSQLRAFTHVADIADGIVRVMNKLRKNGKRGEVYNLGNPDNRISILELAERVLDVVGSNSDIVFVDGRTVYGKHYAEAADKFPDATKAMTVLKWKPEYSVQDTIQSVYNYMMFSEPTIFEQLAGFKVKHPIWT